jgi:hypothetical protein
VAVALADSGRRTGRGRHGVSVCIGEFREHYELMAHEQKHVEQLATLLAAVVCAARPSPRVLDYVRAVLKDVVPPLDPRCCKSRRYNVHVPYNTYYELFVNHVIVR